jgi:hypothetical protein
MACRRNTDTQGAAFTADDNPTHVIAHGPVLTGSYTINSITSPFYGGAVIEPMPGESPGGFSRSNCRALQSGPLRLTTRSPPRAISHNREYAAPPMRVCSSSPDAEQFVVSTNGALR